MSSSLESTSEGTYTLSDGTALAYVAHFPRDRQSTLKLALVAHPWGRLGGTKDDHMVRSLSRLLCDQGNIVVRFDCRGAGESRGTASWTASTEVRDYEEMLNSVLIPLLLPPSHSSTEHARVIELVLCGYSFGSLLASACPIPVSSPAASFQTRLLLVSYPLSVMFALTAFNSSRFTKTLEQSVKEHGVRVCTVFGDGDQFTAIGKLEQWSGRLKQLAPRADQTETIKVEGADHFWARGSEKAEALARIKTWLAS
ncbi:hypothetical protein JCM3766R1_000443 [Sporobolomyces carnicolor]